MAISYDEKREAFQRMLAGRLPKAVSAVRLLANLSRKQDYAWLPAEVQAVLDQLDDAVDVVSVSFGVGAAPAPALAPAPAPAPVAAEAPGGRVEIDQRAEVRWAYDALKRGDHGLAKERMHRVIKVWIEEEKV